MEWTREINTFQFELSEDGELTIYDGSNRYMAFLPEETAMLFSFLRAHKEQIKGAPQYKHNHFTSSCCTYLGGYSWEKGGRDALYYDLYYCRNNGNAPNLIVRMGSGAAESLKMKIAPYNMFAEFYDEDHPFCVAHRRAQDAGHIR